ncbi:hypothetical protein [Gloeothece verrucosa]|uniref:Uncharacterized protein n=1 Tax=Gloeothece verrucosa (strain PCC 7822) TaxID=497965 RepID=E0UAX6_GLOV7|nr:hypothetical protein [Gloeothece verrucosa]ADN15098.1 conserved hypothetical protein [Gloeothece verrucosa PCC 7822]
MPRPGGNPALSEYQFERKYSRSESCTEKMTIRLPPSLKADIKAGWLSDWQEVARIALEEAIAKKKAQAAQNPTD